MLSNYFKTAFRHLRKNRLYATINITGLAAGIACMLLAVLYAKDERSYDRFHRNGPRLYRVTTTALEAGSREPITTGGTGQVQGPSFKAAVPELQDYTRVMGGGIYGDLLANGKVLKQQLIYADGSFFRLFSFIFLQGNPHTALDNIGAAVITESTARQYFNSIDVIGQPLYMDGDPSVRRLGKPLIITGVIKDPPRQSSIRFNVLLPFRLLQLSFEDTDWHNQYLSTFVLLQSGADLNTVAAKFNKVYAAQANTQLAAWKTQYGFDPQVRYGLQPVTDIHLHPLYPPGGSREGGIINGSDPLFSRIFMGIAAFILLMAGINFINISLAGSLKRAKETGVRKITGGSTVQILWQYILESALLCLAAFVLALLVMQAALPVFNELTGRDMLLGKALDGTLVFYCLLILGVLIAFTGAYPAYILSRVKPVQVLYGRQLLSSGRMLLGRSLVVVQFALAVFLVIATIVFYRQMDYIRVKDLGYDPHQVLFTSIEGEQNAAHVQAVLRNELAGETGISHLAFGGERSGLSAVGLEGRQLEAIHRVVDENYLPALGISLKSGRNFSAAYPTDKTNGVIVNEAFVKAAGLRDPLGMQIHTDSYFDQTPKTIIGVVKDFHAASLKERIQPMVMFMSNWYSRTVWIRFDKERQQRVIAGLAAAYKKALPGKTFAYDFLDEANAREYVQEQRWKKIISWAAALSITICCLGLFGLAHIAALQRRKEMGIRKVLGAGIGGMALLFSKDFLKPVMIALLIASPAAWAVMHNWLQHFAYRISLDGWIFITAGLFSILIALMTVLAQLYRVLRVNPINALRATE